MEKYEFTNCGDCINYNQSKFSNECTTCRHYYGCKFEKKMEWYEDESNFPALMGNQQGTIVVIKDKTSALNFIVLGYRLVKSSDVKKLYFDRISK